MKSGQLFYQKLLQLKPFLVWWYCFRQVTPVDNSVLVLAVLSGSAAQAATEGSGRQGEIGGWSSEMPFSPQDWRDRRLVLPRVWAVFQKPQPYRLPVQPYHQLRCPDGHFQTRGGWCQAHDFWGLWFSRALAQSLSFVCDSGQCQQINPSVRSVLPVPGSTCHWACWKDLLTWLVHPLVLLMFSN